ncbi:carboxypeptidase regulatory-like domain-containing protein [Halorubrum halodurans]|uniref:Uncharacterized protein n=1 Tax=Halorubrum halodurans TaxID=1383851 RepID=A0A256IRH7_9EURY|nr:carboxypeptidase regulatory-like domain-containing protein [Halorubrum halodurans]OYR59180.1 hypothetical protein DJ70_01295 [Halorubrum halodurans]
MSFRHDRRGQSVVVGTVILFGFLILAMATYQVQFVPTENAEIEFEHSQQVEGEFLDLRNAILQAGSTGSVQSEPIQLGTRYPQRTFFLNPPPASGSLQTTGAEAIQVNATVGSGAHENVREFWTQTDPRFNTTSIRYTPDYNEYRGAPRLLYEHSVVAAEFDDAVLLRSDQTVVRGDRIAITALTGAISETGVESQSVDPEPISRSSRTVPITGDGGDVEIVLPTAVDDVTALRDRWAAELPNATVTEDGGTVRIALNGSETYRLGLSKVAVDGGGTTEPAYVVPVSGQNVTVGEDVGVEVRDKYNNPVVGAEVSLNGTTENTNADGRAFFEPDAPGDYNATINGTGGQSYESVVFDVSLAGKGGGVGALTRPVFSDGPMATPNTVTQGNSFDLSAIIDNIGRGGTDIVNATWADAQGNSGTLRSVDGSFDQPVEAVESTGIDTAGWNTGIHIITVTATDGNGNSVSEDIEVKITQSQQSSLADSVELVESDTEINNGNLVVRFRNDNSQSITFERAQLVEYDEANAPGNRDPIGIVEYEYGNVELAEGDSLENVTGPTVSNGANVDIILSPVATGASGNSGGNANVERGDTIEFTVEFNDGSQRTYQYTVP